MKVCQTLEPWRWSRRRSWRRARDGEQFDRTHCGGRRVETIGDQNSAIGQDALRVPGAVADHRRPGAERTAANGEDVGGGGGGTTGVRAVGDQQLTRVEGGDAAVVAVPAGAAEPRLVQLFATGS